VTVVPGLSVSAVVSGTVTVGNTINVTAPGLTVTTTQSALTTGQPIWLAPTQTMGVISTIVSVLTVVTILGTQVVTVVPGLSVSAQVSGTVSISGGGGGIGTTFTGQTSNTAQLVWLAQTQTLSVLSTVVTLLGTVNVTIVSNTTNVTGTVSLVTVSSVGTIVTLLGTINVSGSQVITGTVSISGGVTMAQSGQTQVLLYFTGTSVQNNNLLASITLYTGNTRVAVTTLYAVPSGKTLRIMYIAGLALLSTAGAGGTNNGYGIVQVLCATAAASITNTATVGVVAQAFYIINPMAGASGSTFSPLPPQTSFYVGDIYADVPGTTTIGIFVNPQGTGANQPTIAVAVGGYLF